MGKIEGDVARKNFTTMHSLIGQIDCVWHAVFDARRVETFEVRLQAVVEPRVVPGPLGRPSDFTHRAGPRPGHIEHVRK